MRSQKSSGSGPVEAAIDSIGDILDRHHAIPEGRAKNTIRAAQGASMAAFCLYTLIRAAPLIFDSWIVFGIWAGVLAWAAMWIYVGVRGSTGFCQLPEAFWSVVSIGIFGALMIWGTLPGDWSVVNFLLYGFYLAGLAASAMQLWLSLRGMPEMKLDAIRAQQAHGHARDATAVEALTKLDERNAARRVRQFHD